MLYRIVLIYLVLSTLAVTAYIGLGAYIALEQNPSAVYCDYDVAPGEANYTNDSGPCRIRLFLLKESGVILVVILLVVQFPAYLYLLVRRFRRRRRKQA